MSLGDKLKNRWLWSITSVDFNVTFAFSSFAFYTCSLSHFRAFAFYNFPLTGTLRILRLVNNHMKFRNFTPFLNRKITLLCSHKLLFIFPFASITKNIENNEKNIGCALKYHRSKSYRGDWVLLSFFVRKEPQNLVGHSRLVSLDTRLFRHWLFDYIHVNYYSTTFFGNKISIPVL